MRLTLQDLEVLQVGIFGVDVELDTSHWDIKIDAVEDLAQSRSVGGVVSEALPAYPYISDLSPTGMKLTQYRTVQPW